MSIFDDELDRMKKVEVCALIPTISKILKFISTWMEVYPEYACVDTDITSILKKNGYEVTYEELGDYATTGDRWHHFLGQGLHYPPRRIDKNFKYSFMTMKDPNFILNEDNIDDIEYLSVTLKFSKVEIIIIDGCPYINAIGNNILLMKHYPDGGIPDFIKFFRRPTIVLMDHTIPDKIRGVRDDCFFVKYQEGYNLDNVVEEKVISYEEHYKNFLHPYDTDATQGIPNNGVKFTLKTNYASTVQDTYSRPPNWIIPSL